ncbi:MAG: hypothetical protein AAGA75_07560 [Cyanobacteria bacterium P01_E01_bin.6]
MSALDLSTQIPPDINTVERLLAWAALLTHDVNRGLFYKETDDSEGSVPVATAGVVEAADGTDRLIIRIALPVDTAWRSDGSQKFWMFTDEIRDVAIPATFTVS